MATAAGYLGPSLRYVPDGEISAPEIPARADWTQPELQAVPGIPGVITRYAQPRATYSDTPDRSRPAHWALMTLTG